MVLDALIKIKNEIDPTLTFRRSCREGKEQTSNLHILTQTNSSQIKKSEMKPIGMPVEVNLFAIFQWLIMCVFLQVSVAHVPWT